MPNGKFDHRNFGGAWGAQYVPPPLKPVVNLATRGGLDATLGGRTFLGAGDAASKASGASGMLGKAGQFLGSSAAIPIVGGGVSGGTGWLKARAMKQAEEVKARAALRAGDVEAQNELFNRQMVAQEQEKINPREMLSNNALQWMVKDTGALDDDQTYFNYSDTTWDPRHVLTADSGRLARQASEADRRQSTPDGYRDVFMSPTRPGGRPVGGMARLAAPRARRFVPRGRDVMVEDITIDRTGPDPWRGRMAALARRAQEEQQFQGALNRYGAPPSPPTAPVDVGIMEESTTVGPRQVVTQSIVDETLPVRPQYRRAMRSLNPYEGV